MTDLLQRTYRMLLEKNNLPLGSEPENAVTWRLFRADLLDRFQYQVGPYRLDYAWPDLKVALEVDGMYHLLPGAAERDAERDRYLQAQGWLVFRIDLGETHNEQLVRVCRAVHIFRKAGANAP